MSRVPRPDRKPTYTWEGGALIIRRGGNVWRVTGPHAARLHACARAVEAAGLEPGRVLGRCLRGRYELDREQTARESAAEQRGRELREDDGAEGLVERLRASLVEGDGG